MKWEVEVPGYLDLGRREYYKAVVMLRKVTLRRTEVSVDSGKALEKLSRWARSKGALGTEIMLSRKGKGQIWGYSRRWSGWARG